jgi:hypothetical protein
MGNLFCSRCCCPKDQYQGIEDDSNFHNDPGSKFSEALSKEFDLSASIFEGLTVDQKFTSKTSYEPRFVWVNLETLTIHMSTHNTKERRHKEASLSDVTSVERGAPKRLKSASDINSPNSCMTVNFQRGGGIDLKFEADSECDLWYRVLTRVVEYLKKNDRMKSP